MEAALRRLPPVPDSGCRLPAPASSSSSAPPRSPIADSLRVLQQLHRRRNYRPVAETIQDLLDATRAHVGIVLRSAGEQALANVLHVAELAREYEAGGGLSFRGFVDELRDAAENAQAAEAPILEEGSDGVRLMTVHKAKGLEFPIVILADLTCKLSRAEAGRWLDPAQQPVRAEDRRLVADRSAAARRRGGGARPRRVRAPDLRRRHARARHPRRPGHRRRAVRRRLARSADAGDLSAGSRSRRDPQRAPGVPDFKSKDSVLHRPDGDPASPKTVAPGTFRVRSARSPNARQPRQPTPSPGGIRARCGLGAASSFGLRRDDLIVKDGDMFAVEDRLADYEQWRDERGDGHRGGRAPERPHPDRDRLGRRGGEARDRRGDCSRSGRLSK